MGTYNCIGFQSRLPIRSGDEIALFLGLHASPQLEGKYAFDPVEFAPGLSFTPIALPIMCRYDDGRMVRDVERDGNVKALEAGLEKDEALRLLEKEKKDCHIWIDIEFQKRNVGNLNPKYTGTSVFKDCESCRRSLLLSIYRLHADILFCPELKNLFLGFLQFYQVLRHHGWMMTLPIYGGQDDKLPAMAPLYHRMAEWVEINKIINV